MPIYVGEKIDGCSFDPRSYVPPDYYSWPKEKKIEFWKEVTEHETDVHVRGDILVVVCDMCECSDTYGAFGYTFCHGVTRYYYYDIDTLKYLGSSEQECW